MQCHSQGLRGEFSEERSGAAIVFGLYCRDDADTRPLQTAQGAGHPGEVISSR
jgi:hypothetical protein